MKKSWYSIIYEQISQYVSGQEDAKQKFSTLGHLYLHKISAIKAGISPSKLPRLSAMVIGPTGTGKTLLGSTLARILGEVTGIYIPFYRIDCSNMSRSNWAGEDLYDKLSAFMKILPTEGFGIIMLDELDKLCLLHGSTNVDDYTSGIQYNLLDLLDGKVNTNLIHPRINNCLVICAGAFSQMYKEEFTDKRGIGFNLEKAIEKDIHWKKLMVKYGLIPELVGRIVDVVETKALTESDIRNILFNTKDSVYAKYKHLLVDFDLTNKDIDVIVNEVVNSEFGMRELDTVIFNIVQTKIKGKNEPNKN